MLAKVLLVMASAVVALWGIMHIAKTRAVVAGFEPLTDDNRHVLRMEWIIEGVALTFVSALVLGATFILGVQTPGAKFVYIMSVTFLLVLALVSLFTGAKASPLPYKLCARSSQHQQC